MRIILAGSNSHFAYWSNRGRGNAGRLVGTWKRQDRLCGFARLPAFNANGNHAPAGAEGAVTSDHGMRLLRRIAGRNA